MTLFSSRRERRLWIALGVVLAAIYATLGQTPALVAALGPGLVDSAESNLVFAIIILLVAIPIFFIDKRPRRSEIAIGLGILTVYLLAWLRMGSWEERSHLFEYALVAALIHEALLERRANGRLAPAPTLLALMLALLLGIIDEAVQHFLPNRHFELVDVLFNSLASTIIIGSRWLLARLRTWAKKRKPGA